MHEDICNYSNLLMYHLHLFPTKVPLFRDILAAKGSDDLPFALSSQPEGHQIECRCNDTIPVCALQAMAAYRTAARLFPGLHLPLTGMGMEYQRMNNLHLAEQMFLQVCMLSVLYAICFMFSVLLPAADGLLLIACLMPSGPLPAVHAQLHAQSSFGCCSKFCC